MPGVERVQTGLRMDKSLLKVMKGVAEYLNLSLADLMEGILLNVLEGKAPLHDEETLAAIAHLRTVYGLELTAADAHQHPEPDHPDHQ